MNAQQPEDYQTLWAVRARLLQGLSYRLIVRRA